MHFNRFRALIDAIEVPTGLLRAKCNLLALLLAGQQKLSDIDWCSMP
jgi:hypothetical protein